MSGHEGVGRGPEGEWVKRAAGRGERNRREARWLALLRGPGVVPLRGSVETVDGTELRLERALGSLADVVAERGPLPDGEVRAVGAATARALQRLHGRGLVHGDVKPANLLLAPGGGLWLADLDATTPADGRPLHRHSPGRNRTAPTARPGTDLEALAASLVELAGARSAEPGPAWRPADLVSMGCSPALAELLAPVISGDYSADAIDLARALEACGPTTLPAPARRRLGCDTTPTVDFDPLPSPAPAETAAAAPATVDRRVVVALLFTIIVLATIVTAAISTSWIG